MGPGSDRDGTLDPVPATEDLLAVLTAGGRRSDRLTHVEHLPARPGRTAPWPAWADPDIVAGYRSLGVARTHLRVHRKAVGGEEARRAILTSLISHDVAFIYEQDRRSMIENNHAFEAFVCALTAFLKFKKRTEPRPGGFPADEDWVEIPKAEMSWKDL